MSLPRLIEFIESVPRPGGGFASEHGGGQILVAAFAPATTLAASVTPASGVYALIGYRADLSPVMVPSAFTGVVQHFGHTYYTGTLTATLIKMGLEFYMVITSQAPVEYAVTNASGLLQYFEVVSQYALVPTEEDYKTIIEALDDLAQRETRESLSGLRDEAKALAGLMRRAAPTPPAIIPRPITPMPPRSPR